MFCRARYTTSENASHAIRPVTVASHQQKDSREMSSPLTNLSDTSSPAKRSDLGLPPDRTAMLRAAEEAVLDWTGIPIAREDVEVDGTRLHYLSCGEGEPLLLLH